ncbi:MAG: hypothetical protein OER56_00545 [Hyphomicrobiales bacterium]|nr:hypothetical protein [Hyphomicrobiales bacterium]
MQAKTQRRPVQDDSIWPQEDDQARVVENKPANVPHFLCRAQQAPADEPNRRAPARPSRAATREETRMAGYALLAEQPAVANRPQSNQAPKNFTPVSPHLHQMMMNRRAEIPTRHEPPSWVQETFQEHNAAERQRVYKGVAIAACLVLASGIGLTVTAMEFKGTQNSLPATLNSSLAAILPTFNKQSEPPKKIPVMVIPSPAKPEKVAAPKAAGKVRVLTKIGSVKLTVEDTNGSAQAPIALPVTAEAGDSQPPIAVKLTGLPAQATLSAGSKQADASWLVQSNELAGLQLTVPQAPDVPLKVTVAAIETETGELAAPMQEMTIKVDPKAVIIEPAALPATNSQNYSGEAAASKTNFSASDAAIAMRSRGDETLALGDVAGARGFYKMALKMGDIASAARIGRTYDPVVYQAVGVRGLKPDPKMAERWYKHAISEGDASAREDLMRMVQQAQ